VRIILTALSLVALSLTQAAAQAEDGATALARKDYREAFRLFQEEAPEGSGGSQLALALMYDLGMGTPQNTALAFDWYLKAAQQGIAEAQFNLAVMLDSGIGRKRDAAAAAIYYARAAINGSARGMYNLAQLYEAGDGVPRNVEMARYWLIRAGDELPAAAERLAKLEDPTPAERLIGGPIAASGAVVQDDAGKRAELVWSAAPGDEGDTFILEIWTLPENGATSGRLLTTLRTQGTAIVAQLDDAEVAWGWRIFRVAAEGNVVSASGWLPLNTARSDQVPALPQGHVTLSPAIGDDAAIRLAQELAAALVAGGLWVDILPATVPAEQSSVMYFHSVDAALARSIAVFLPVLQSDDAVLGPQGSASLPGEIVIQIVGGPQG